MKLLVVDRVKGFPAELEEAFCRLLPQLSPRLAAPLEERVRQMLAHPTTALFVAREAEAPEAAMAAGSTTPTCADDSVARGRIVGVLTLVWYDAPSGRKAWIEDVVVDAAARGFGAGEALVRAAQAHAAAVGAGKVMLTSNPSRGAARRLYAKMGFKEAETTVFACKTDTE